MSVWNLWVRQTDWDLVRGTHQGQRHEKAPRQQAGHTIVLTAPAITEFELAMQELSTHDIHARMSAIRRWVDLPSRHAVGRLRAKGRHTRHGALYSVQFCADCPDRFGAFGMD